MLKVVFLGTAGSLPTIIRNPSAFLINYEGELILFDCGEGTQKQMMKAKTGMQKLTSIFISHLHADHILGLPGLLQTMAFQGRTEPIMIYGPKGILDFIKNIEKLFTTKLKFKIITKQLINNETVKKNNYCIKAILMNHGIETFGYIFEENEKPGKFNKEKAESLGIEKGPLYSKLHHGEKIKLNDGRVIDPYKDGIVGKPRKGIKISYSGDTRENEYFMEKAKNSNLLIHEATFSKNEKDLAYEWGHSTASGVAILAKKYNIKVLALVHISQRFTDKIDIIMNEAKKEFDHTIIPNDLEYIEIKN